MSQHTITYNWRILNMDVAKSEDGLSDVVKTVHWRLTGESDDGFIGDRGGILSLPAPSPSDFVPLDGLDKAAVTAWLESTIDAITAKIRAERPADPEPDPENPDAELPVNAPDDSYTVEDYKSQIAADIERERNLATVPFIPSWG